MAKLTKEEVGHVAKLARLSLSDIEVGKFGDQLSEVLEYMKQLDEVDISDVEPTSQTTGLTNVFRKDEVDVNNVLKVEKSTSGTEEVHNDYFKVPVLIDKNKQ